MHYSNVPPGHSHVLTGFLGAGELTDTCIKQSQCICSQNNGPILSDSAYQLVSPHHDALSKTLASGYSYPRLGSQLSHLASSPLYFGFSHKAPNPTLRAQALVFVQNLVLPFPPGSTTSETEASLSVPLQVEEAVKDQTLHLASTPKKKKGGKKYKPVAVKVKPIVGKLPSKFRIIRNIIGDPLEHLPVLLPHPPKFTPCGQYTAERKEIIDKHNPGFLLTEERKLLHHFMVLHQDGFTWDDTERGHFCEDFFPLIDMPVVPHKPWVLCNIPIPPGIYDDVCKAICRKLQAGTFEPSNSSY